MLPLAPSLEYIYNKSMSQLFSEQVQIFRISASDLHFNIIIHVTFWWPNDACRSVCNSTALLEYSDKTRPNDYGLGLIPFSVTKFSQQKADFFFEYNCNISFQMEACETILK
jgi:hypothetical protein